MTDFYMKKRENKLLNKYRDIQGFHVNHGYTDSNFEHNLGSFTLKCAITIYETNLS